MNRNTENELEKLKKLIYDYSFHQNKNLEILSEIDNLMNRAMEKVIKRGMTTVQVAESLGQPLVVVGEGEDEKIEWLYPCLPAESDTNPAHQFNWYWQLNFKFRKLESYAKTRGIFEK